MSNYMLWIFVSSFYHKSKPFYAGTNTKHAAFGYAYIDIIDIGVKHATETNTVLT